MTKKEGVNDRINEIACSLRKQAGFVTEFIPLSAGLLAVTERGIQSFVMNRFPIKAIRE
ncbi:hypothetical protein KAS42_04610 [bacterium]|nr:hypothetical protein [bacterium]